MSLQTYIDNEVPDFGEWDSISEAGNSTVSQIAAAGFPERGQAGLRIVIDGTSNAFANKDYGEVLAAGADFYFAFWLNVRVLPSGTKAIFEVDDAGASIAEITLTSGGLIGMTMTDDGGSASTSTVAITTGRWTYIAGRVTRATGAASNDGTAALWVDNFSVGTLAAKDNFNTLENNMGVQLGFASTGTDGAILDYDEFQSDSSYPQSFSPIPPSTSPGTRRIALLAQAASVNGVAFADYVIQQTGLPRSHVLMLPNATTSEALADLATWDSQVEDDIDAWVALMAVAWAKMTTFVLGHLVSGYFTEGGVKHSTVSRLMNYGNAFSSQTSNPLYNPSTVARLTVTSLNAAGVYLASRIEADSLANAKTVLDQGLVATLISRLRESDIFYSDDATLRSALDTQHLRLETADIA